MAEKKMSPNDTLKRRDPAALVFQALRMHINDEVIDNNFTHLPL
jgi:16S rRNA C1402 N4-methylase RsmH